jgi:hypothetical protein
MALTRPKYAKPMVPLHEMCFDRLFTGNGSGCRCEPKMYITAIWLVWCGKAKM